MPILSQSIRGRARSRLSWIAASLATLLFGVVAAFGTARDAPEQVYARTIIEPLALPASSQDSESDEVFVREDRFQRGDTIAALLERLDVDNVEAERLLRSREGTRPFRLLRPGTTVQAKTVENGSLLSMWFIVGRDQLISIERAGDGFNATEQSAELTRQIQMKSGEIKSSLFAATDAAGISDSVAMQIADIFAGDIDFHRDLRRGDKFTVVFEMFDHLGRPVKSGRVLAAEFVNQNRSYRAVWFQDADGHGGYYTPEGKNLRKAFLRSPLEFSRITSGFTRRFHPILREWRDHKGIDYGAPTGTRVKATGDGVVEFVGRKGGYGKLVMLRHAGGIVTAYAHLSAFANGLRKGGRIGQGELVGYVGQTGFATGPHLHYEFRVNNQQRNPLTIAFPAAQPVAQNQMAAFRTMAEPLVTRLDLLATSNLALLE